MVDGRIQGNGFQLWVSHWDPFKGGIPRKLKLKISISQLNLPLVCWNSQAMAMIIRGFGLPHRASKSCLKWEDLTPFDFDFFCEEN